MTDFQIFYEEFCTMNQISLNGLSIYPWQNFWLGQVLCCPYLSAWSISPGYCPWPLTLVIISGLVSWVSDLRKKDPYPYKICCYSGDVLLCGRNLLLLNFNNCDKQDFFFLKPCWKSLRYSRFSRWDWRNSFMILSNILTKWEIC